MRQRSKPVGETTQGRPGADKTRHPDDTSFVPQSPGEDDKVRQAFEDLTDEERLVAILKKVGFSHTEISAELGLSVDVVDELSRMALTKVRRLRDARTSHKCVSGDC